MNPPALDALLERAFTCILQASLAASVLAGLVALIFLVFQKHLPPRWRYALWLLVMLRLLVPITPSSSLSVFNLQRHTLPAGTKPLPPSYPSAPPAIAASGSQPIAEMAPAPVLSPNPGQPAERGQARSLPTLRTAFRYLWLGGAAGYLVLVILQHRKLAHWVKHQPAFAAPRVLTLVKTAQATLGLSGDIPVTTTERQGSPAVLGVLRPRLLLPRSVVDSLDDQELRLVLLHELVHIRRRDALLNWVAILAQSLHWFNPLVWLVLKRWRADRELVCDAEVMARLTPPERHTYGATLLKLATTFSEPFFARSVTPILEHKHEIERRITMIARYKPTHRMAAAALLLSLTALGALTFTRAAEKLPVPTPAAQPDKEPVSDQQERTAKVRIAYLEKELARINQVLRQTQAELDTIKLDLRMTEAEAGGASVLDPETLRKLETSRIEAAARCRQIETMYTNFANLKKGDLKQAILVNFPDQQLAALLGNENAAEQKLAEMRSSYASEHPEVQRVSNLLQTINRQTEERLQGFLAGLRAKLEAQRAEAEAMQKSIAEAKDIDIKRMVERRPYVAVKSDLERLTALRERLQTQLIAEKINAGVPLTW